MNRRQFTQGLGAVASLATAPAQALNAVKSLSPAATLAKTSKMNPYTWGAFLARARADITHDLLVSDMYYSDEVAQDVLSFLVKNKTVMPPDVNGVYRAVDPIISQMHFAPRVVKANLKDETTRTTPEHDAADNMPKDTATDENDDQSDIAAISDDTHEDVLFDENAPDAQQQDDEVTA